MLVMNDVQHITEDKRGQGGRAIYLIGNFFTLISMPNWKLSQRKLKVYS
jgi:hypothetical protein